MESLSLAFLTPCCLVTIARRCSSSIADGREYPNARGVGVGYRVQGGHRCHRPQGEAGVRRERESEEGRATSRQESCLRHKDGEPAALCLRCVRRKTAAGRHLAGFSLARSSRLSRPPLAGCASELIDRRIRLTLHRAATSVRTSRPPSRNQHCRWEGRNIAKLRMLPTQSGAAPSYLRKLSGFHEWSCSDDSRSTGINKKRPQRTPR